jgi:kumamolisin
VTGSEGRGVPDVAGNAGYYSGYVLRIYNTTTDQLYDVGPDGDGAICGTSAVAPLYAALTALINMKLGFQVGYLNPTLYKIGTNPGLYQRVFRDMADGVSNAYNGAPGYVAGAGWDACTVGESSTELSWPTLSKLNPFIYRQISRADPFPFRSSRNRRPGNGCP